MWNGKLAVSAGVDEVTCSAACVGHLLMLGTYWFYIIKEIIMLLVRICKIITSKVKALNGADVCNYAQFGQAGF